MFERVHKGFDNLDLAFDGQISPDFANILERAKKAAQENGVDHLISVNGVDLQIKPNGSKGGYQYIADTGPTGETWQFKKPTPNGKFGIFVSVRAVRLALHGLGRVREHLLQRLDAFGVLYTPGSERINRVDLAVDFFMPDFELEESHFVLSERMTMTKDGYGVAYRTDGTSNRLTGYRVGKNPARVMNMYDKRHQVMKEPLKYKYWFEIYNANRIAQGKPVIDFSDPHTSRVWRIELRLHKRALTKKRYSVKTFGDLQNKLPWIFIELLNDVRYVVPTADSNRSRWPMHPLWLQMKKEVRSELESQRVDLPEEFIVEIGREERRDMIERQIAGCIVSLGGLYKVPLSDFAAFAEMTFDRIRNRYERDKDRLAKKLAAAVERFSVSQPKTNGVDQ